MKKHNYIEEMINDIIDYIEENQINYYDIAEDEEKFQELEDKLWLSDQVTGNASGSYYFNTWKAEEALCHNFDLLQEACMEFGYKAIYDIQDGAEKADVMIRCYLLNTALNDAVQRLIDRDTYKDNLPF